MRTFRSANYPVASRRDLLVPDTWWVSGGSSRGFRVRLIELRNDMALIARQTIRPGQIPSASWLAADSLLRNYRREDES